MSATKKKDVPEKQSNLSQDLAEYFKGVKSEWYKITWPERSQYINQTLVVIVITLFFTAFVFLLDSVYGSIFKWLLGLSK